MAAIPSFEKVAIVGDDPHLVAVVASLFTRPSRYLPIIDGPRMGRSDWSNEVIRRSNALAKAGSRRVIATGLPAESARHLSQGWPDGLLIQVKSAEEAEIALKGWVKTPDERMPWGKDNLGVGLLLARRSKKQLQIVDEASPTTGFVSGGAHLLIVCEQGDELAQVTSSNLAFALDAAFLVISELSDQECDDWMEEIYALDSGPHVSNRFEAICRRARQRLPSFNFDQFRQILFVTNGFPWGVSVPECVTTHMFVYPDLGRSIVEGMWASQEPSRSARNALLIHPQQVTGSEIEAIAKSLEANRTLCRIESDQRATVSRVDQLFDSVPFDIIVLSTHAGDVSGERDTYEFVDSEGHKRRLIVDEAVGFGYDQKSKKVLVKQFHRFHELDGVSWVDHAAKKNLYVGTAIQSWVDLGDVAERRKFRVHSEPISRVRGSMALQMHDNPWMPTVHAFPPSCSPIIINNACSSWHQLSKRLSFAGARAYVGTLFPVTEFEAQEVGTALFRGKPGRSLSKALWETQSAVYGKQWRRPYSMIGLPFCATSPNTIDSVAYLRKEYMRAIRDYIHKEQNDESSEIRENSRRIREFLSEDFKDFTRVFGEG